ncbi:hypothetical protein HanRHA438_Chr09g0384341 [Helianthus annuus]|nr:hypothetical protein HanRHA438_Chr09g0384341 [Helianthus annuus]
MAPKQPSGWQKRQKRKRVEELLKSQNFVFCWLLNKHPGGKKVTHSGRLRQRSCSTQCRNTLQTPVHAAVLAHRGSYHLI